MIKVLENAPIRLTFENNGPVIVEMIRSSLRA
jgi:hypothetical protein